jgi:hypothetical protein
MFWNRLKGVTIAHRRSLNVTLIQWFFLTVHHIGKWLKCIITESLQNVLQWLWTFVILMIQKILRTLSLFFDTLKDEVLPQNCLHCGMCVNSLSRVQASAQADILGLLVNCCIIPKSLQCGWSSKSLRPYMHSLTFSGVLYCACIHCCLSLFSAFHHCCITSVLLIWSVDGCTAFSDS